MMAASWDQKEKRFHEGLGGHWPAGGLLGQDALVLRLIQIGSYPVFTQPLDWIERERPGAWRVPYFVRLFRRMFVLIRRSNYFCISLLIARLREQNVVSIASRLCGIPACYSHHQRRLLQHSILLVQNGRVAGLLRERQDVALVIE